MIGAVSQASSVSPLAQDPVTCVLTVSADATALALATAAADELANSGTAVRVVSMPCAEKFMQQDAGYRDSVLPPQIRARVAVEAGHPDYWTKFVGLDGTVVGIDQFGVSAPGGAAMEAMGMTTERVVSAVKAVL